MKIRIDGREIIVKSPNKNIVEIADENGISMMAPCFRKKKRNGCCRACVIEVDGTQKHACGTKPYDGMEITYEREDLSNIRKARLIKYTEAIKSGDMSKNTCNGCGSSSPKSNTETSSKGCCC